MTLKEAVAIVRAAMDENYGPNYTLKNPTAAVAVLQAAMDLYKFTQSTRNANGTLTTR